MITGKDHQKNTRRIVAVALMLVVLALSLVVMSTYARDGDSAVAVGESVDVETLFQSSPTLDDHPAGLYVQEWSPDEDGFYRWNSDWDTWAAGAQKRVWWQKVDATGKSLALNGMLDALPEGKEAIVGFYPKNNVIDCHFGMDPKYYAAPYTPLRLKDVNIELDEQGNKVYVDRERTCGGTEISYAIDFTNTDL
ncbi:MAG: hypothetical protein GY759_02245, partial [Chloroflexi bacterium]|nr:hypothetical protein [Chloroflexota bacterium]